MPDIPAVHELRLVVTADDYDEALRFYRDVLGLPERAAFASPGARGGRRGDGDRRPRPGGGRRDRGAYAHAVELARRAARGAGRAPADAVLRVGRARSARLSGGRARPGSTPPAAAATVPGPGPVAQRIERQTSNLRAEVRLLPGPSAAAPVGRARDREHADHERPQRHCLLRRNLGRAGVPLRHRAERRLDREEGSRGPPQGRCSSHRRQRDPRVRDHPLVIKRDLQIVQADRPVIVHHQGDLRPQGPGCLYSLEKPRSALRRSFLLAHRTAPAHRRAGSRFSQEGRSLSAELLEADPDLRGGAARGTTAGISFDEIGRRKCRDLRTRRPTGLDRASLSKTRAPASRRPHDRDVEVAVPSVPQRRSLRATYISVPRAEEMPPMSRMRSAGQPKPSRSPATWRFASASSLQRKTSCSPGILPGSTITSQLIVFSAFTTLAPGKARWTAGRANRCWRRRGRVAFPGRSRAGWRCRSAGAPGSVRASVA